VRPPRTARCYRRLDARSVRSSLRPVTARHKRRTSQSRKRKLSIVRLHQGGTYGRVAVFAERVPPEYAYCPSGLLDRGVVVPERGAILWSQQCARVTPDTQTTGRTVAESPRASLCRGRRFSRPYLSPLGTVVGQRSHAPVRRRRMSMTRPRTPSTFGSIAQRSVSSATTDNARGPVFPTGCGTTSSMICKRGRLALESGPE
jgi:hypothetical protein